MILSIDPGSSESAYVLMNNDLKPIIFGKFTNLNVRAEIRRILRMYYSPDRSISVVTEMVACYDMAVGKEVFDTCVWVGRFTEMAEHENVNTYYIYRREEKMNLCKTMKAKDSNIIQALADRFAPDTPNKGKGVKAHKGWFYGFKKDIWQAYAVGVTYYDLYLKGDK